MARLHGSYTIEALMNCLRPAGVSFALVSSAWLVLTPWIAAHQAPASPAAPPQTSVAAPAPAQFPPLGAGVSADERVTLQASVDRLSARVARLKKAYPSGQMSDRVADVEVYLDAVRRPLQYDE